MVSPAALSVGHPSLRVSHPCCPTPHTTAHIIPSPRRGRCAQPQDIDICDGDPSHDAKHRDAGGPLAAGSGQRCPVQSRLEAPLLRSFLVGRHSQPQAGGHSERAVWLVRAWSWRLVSDLDDRWMRLIMSEAQASLTEAEDWSESGPRGKGLRSVVRHGLDCAVVGALPEPAREPGSLGEFGSARPGRHGAPHPSQTGRRRERLPTI
eukprot:1874818-Rhodomonas_salina.1